MVLAIFTERGVPPRLRLSHFESFRKQSKYQATPKRPLLKLLFSSWRKIGCPRPRGYLSLDLRMIKQWFEDIAALRHEVEAGNLDLDEMTRGEFNEVALDFLAERGLH